MGYSTSFATAPVAKTSITRTAASVEHLVPFERKADILSGGNLCSLRAGSRGQLSNQDKARIGNCSTLVGSWTANQIAFSCATLALASALVRSRRFRGAFSRRRLGRAACVSLAALAKEEGVQLISEQFAQFDVEKIDQYTLPELEELYIDSLWSYYRTGQPVLKDGEFDRLKQQLYRMDSRFPTLKRQEVAFVEAAIAYYRGKPVVSDEEYEALKKEIKASGKRKDVTAFLLYERGEQLLTSAQFGSMKEEYAKMGLTAVNIDQCNLAQLEEMYIDALWAYYHDGVQLLNDAQYDKLKQELEWQASGFPTLRRYEIDFVKASLAYWQGKPVATDEEWKELKRKVLADGKRKEVTAFLLYSKGQDVLDPDKFNQMADELARIGVKVKRADSRALDATLSVESVRLDNDLAKVFAMVAALSFLPIAACTAIAWSIGIFLDFEFIPAPSWGSLLTAEAIPLFLVGIVSGSAITWQLFQFLDIQNPRILTGKCPSCQSEVKIFTGGANPAKLMDTSCASCGCEIKIDTVINKIVQAGLGVQVGSDEDDQGFDWKQAWPKLKETAKPLLSRVRPE